MVTPHAEPSIADNPYLDAAPVDTPEDLDLDNVVRLPVGRVVLAEAVQEGLNESHFTLEDQITPQELRNIEIYSRLVIGRKVNESEAAAFRVYVESFVFPLYRLTRERPSSAPQRDSIDERLYEFRRYLEGADSTQIANEVGIKSSTAAVRRTNSVQQVMHRHCPIEQQSRYFKDFLDGKLLPDPGDLVPEREFSERTKRKLGSAAIEKEPTPRDILRSTLPKILQGLDTEDIKTMSEHLLGISTNTQSAGFLRASMRLGWATGLAFRRTRHAQRNGVALRQRVELQDYRLIEKLLTDNLTFREPWTVGDIVKGRLSQSPGSGATAESIKWEICRVIEKVAQICQPSETQGKLTGNVHERST